jgi:hypothetical protein
MSWDRLVVECGEFGHIQSQKKSLKKVGFQLDKRRNTPLVLEYQQKEEAQCTSLEVGFTT